MSPQQRQEKITWWYRTFLTAITGTSLTFIVMTYNSFQQSLRTQERHDVRITVLEKQSYDQAVGLQIQTGRIDKIYESGILRKYQPN